MPQDKLTAVRIKQHDGQYSPQIPVGAKSSNVKYKNTQYNLDEILGNVKTNVAPLQEQIDNIQTDAIGDAVQTWMTNNATPSDSLVLDSSLTQENQPAQAKAAGKLITINDEIDGQSTKLHLNTKNQTISLATTDDTLEIQHMIISDFISSSTYKINDYVSYNNTLYKCIIDINPADNAWIPEHWTEVKAASEIAYIKNTITGTNKLLENIDYTDFPYEDSTNQNKRIKIKQNGNILVLNNLAPTAETTNYSGRFYRLNNGVKFYTELSEFNSDSRHCSLIQGHKYRLLVKKISGSITVNNSGDLRILVVTDDMDRGESSRPASNIDRSPVNISLIDLVNENYFDFIAEANKTSNINIVIRTSNGILCTNFKIGVYLIDLTSSKNIIDIDEAPIENSTNPISSGGVYSLGSTLSNLTNESVENLKNDLNTLIGNIDYIDSTRNEYIPPNNILTRIAVNQYGNIITLNNPEPTSESSDTPQRLYRLNNGVQYFNTSTGANSDSRKLLLIKDHRYRLLIKKISGSVSGSNLKIFISDRDTIPFSSGRDSPALLTLIDLEDVKYADFIAEKEIEQGSGIVPINIILYTGNGTTCTNFKIGVYLIDLDESKNIIKIDDEPVENSDYPISSGSAHTIKSNLHNLIDNNTNNILDEFNTLIGNVDYFDTNMDETPTTQNNRIRIEHNNNIFTLNNSTSTEVSTYLYYRLNNGIIHYAVSDHNSDTTHFPLIAGHKYRLLLKKISGSVTTTAESSVSLRIIVEGYPNKSTLISMSLLELQDILYQDFIASEIDPLINIVIRTTSNILCTNLKLGIYLIDLNASNDIIDLNTVYNTINTKLDAAYDQQLNLTEIFGNENGGWERGYYNSRGKTGSNPNNGKYYIRTNNDFSYIAQSSDMQITFTVPEGKHAVIIEYDEDDLEDLTNNTEQDERHGDLDSGSNVLTIDVTPGYKYRFCVGYWTSSADIDDILASDEFISSLNVTIVKSFKTSTENNFNLLENKKLENTYEEKLDFVDIFGDEDNAPFGWIYGYYNSKGKTGRASPETHIRTYNGSFIAKQGDTSLTFTVPDGYHACIIEILHDQKQIIDGQEQNVVNRYGDFNSGLSTLTIPIRKDDQYKFCIGNLPESTIKNQPFLDEQFLSEISITIKRSVMSTITDHESRILRLESDEYFPDYYMPYLQNKLNEISTLQYNIDPNHDSFWIITDYHFQHNQGNSIGMLKWLSRRTGIQKIFYLGDAGGILGTALEAKIKRLQLSSNAWYGISSCVDEFYGVLGNHEWIPQPKSPTSCLSTSNMIGTYLNRYKTKISNFNSQTGNYYVDNVANKIRYFCIQCTSRAYPLGFDWLAEQLALVPDGWSVAIMTHFAYVPNRATLEEHDVPYEIDGQGNYIYDEDDPGWLTYNNLYIKGMNQLLHAMLRKTSFTINNVVYDYSGLSGTRHVIGIFSGHKHHGYLFSPKYYPENFDINNMSDIEGVTVFRGSTDCSTANVAINNHPWYWQDGIVGGNKIERLAGTTDEQCFYAVHVDLENKHLYINAVGGDHNWDDNYESSEIEQP